MSGGEGGWRMAAVGGSLERAIMEVLWAADRPLRVREMLPLVAAEGSRQPAYNTVQTVADRLAHKGMLTRIPDRNAFRYAPTRSRDDHVTDLMVDMLAQAPDHGSVLARFAQSVDDDDARRLMEALRLRIEREA